MKTPHLKVKPPRLRGLNALLARYRRAVKSIEKLKAEHFYHGTAVTVNHSRYKGPGLAVTDGECWPDHVSVSLPNGNTWRYPLESVLPNPMPPSFPYDRSERIASD